MGDEAAVERWSERRLELGRARGDGPVIARSLVGLGLAAMESDPERARAYYLEAAAVAQDCGDTMTLAMATTTLGSIAFQAGDAETARPLLQQGLVLAREVSDARCEAGALLELSSLAFAEGDTDEAAALLSSCLRLASSVGYTEFIYWSLLGSAEVAAQRGETVRAARLLGAADAVREEVGYGDDSDSSEREQRARIATALNADDAALAAAQSGGRALALDDAVAYALEEHDPA
jgi:non-specific serine/threonine protein kinase